MKIYSFSPIADPASRILILGTMPGKDSLKYQQYYAHPRNAFWKIMFAIYSQPYSDNYEVKMQLLLSHHIALWDTLKVCIRSTSLDSDILMEEPNNLIDFLKEHPGIVRFFFNGHKAAGFFKSIRTLFRCPVRCSLLPVLPYAISFKKKTASVVCDKRLGFIKFSALYIFQQLNEKVIF